jgi:hypothetical protein
MVLKGNAEHIVAQHSIATMNAILQKGLMILKIVIVENVEIVLLIQMNQVLVATQDFQMTSRSKSKDI